ncbi:uncharacterized protein LOC144706365 [Wolffia australiana]
MAFAGFTGSGVFYSQDGFQPQIGCGGRSWPLPKDFHCFSQGDGKPNISAPGLPLLKPSEYIGPWKYIKECDHLSRPPSLLNRQEIIDLQDDRQTDVFEQSVVHAADEFHLYDAGGDYLQDSLVYPESEVILPKPALESVENFDCSSGMRILPDSRMLFIGTDEEISDLLSMLSDLYQSRKSTTLSRRQMVIPYFRRSRNGGRPSMPSTNMEAKTVTQRAKTVKPNPSTSKKETRRATKERDMYRKNLFHACESLLLMILGGSRGEMAFLSLKKSGPEVSNLLMQVCTGIIGTAIAVFFSVVWRIAVLKAPFSSAKLLSAGLALSLVWLSEAVNSLRENIVLFSRNSGKVAFVDRKMRLRFEKSMKQIFYRTLTLMAVALLRYA